MLEIIFFRPRKAADTADIEILAGVSNSMASMNEGIGCDDTPRNGIRQIP
jgi:hypothetical protein